MFPTMTMSATHASGARAAQQRADRIDRIRREIAAGVYLTPERIARAVDALFDDLTSKDNRARRRVG